jgi:hypothetical protein
MLFKVPGGGSATEDDIARNDARTGCFATETQAKAGSDSKTKQHTRIKDLIFDLVAVALLEILSCHINQSINQNPSKPRRVVAAPVLLWRGE